MRLLTSVFLTIIALLGLSTQATAHDQLVDIQPASGSVVETAKFEMSLTFNNPLLVVQDEVNAELATRIVGKTDWVNHPISVRDRELTALVSLKESGFYEVRWKVVSSDGHPIEGLSDFEARFEVPAETEEPGDGDNVVIAPAPTQSEEKPSLTGFYFGLAMVIAGAVLAPIGLMMRRRARKS